MGIVLRLAKDVRGNDDTVFLPSMRVRLGSVASNRSCSATFRHLLAEENVRLEKCWEARLYRCRHLRDATPAAVFPSEREGGGGAAFGAGRQEPAQDAVPVECILLFGSYARGEQNSDSDAELKRVQAASYSFRNRFPSAFPLPLATSSRGSRGRGGRTRAPL